MAEKVKVTFLGTSGIIPDDKRGHPATLLTYNNENILVDCGEGTQVQFRKAHLNPCKVTRILITHWHGDHTLGLPGMLKTLSMSEYNKKLFIYGPKGIKKHIERMDAAFGKVHEYEIEVVEVVPSDSKPVKFFENDEFYLEASAMSHGTPCNAYSFVNKGHVRIDKKKMKKLKLPQGKHLQNLKKGKDVTLNGKKFKAKELTFREGDKKVSFILDTEMNSNIAALVKDSDLIVSEATFGAGMDKQAKEYKHLTVGQATKIAKKAKAKKLYLTHLSARNDRNLKEFLSDAKKNFKETHLAKDLMSVEV